ncbi:MAG TPA: lysine 2,3-aminomutase [Oceanithermus profundus]|uniref:Lysine 2,3-aminomutase n=1 Tax=Oceanithermus profundus TaxID=187137 RepID=A0A7C4VAV4_9DEIN|nr:lysine 2,3-aminomutase [Oceanithermus profundus]
MYATPVDAYGRYEPVTLKNIHDHPGFRRIPEALRHEVEVAAQVLPFRTNPYVLDELIDWDAVPDDPIFQLVFPQRAMLEPEAFARVEAALAAGDRDALTREVWRVRRAMNPHPAGQLTHNVPELDGRRLAGLQHKYAETVLFFPAGGQTCHAFCTYCFRWAQFVGDRDLKFESNRVEDLVRYLRAHPEVTDVLVTGGDPMVMKTALLARYLEPLLEVETLRSIRIGSKSLAYWPMRFTTDPDAAELLRLFERVVARGKQLAFMAHFSHPRELETGPVRAAIQNLLGADAVIRTQAPLVRHVNDDADVWAEKWRREVSLGLVPYYMFVERDTGPKRYFEVPLAEAQRIFAGAYRQVSGLARTVRGPSMSAFPGKVRIVGTAEVAGEKVFVLEFLQARDPSWVGRPFFARYSETATWLDELEPAFGAARFFYEA